MISTGRVPSPGPAEAVARERGLQIGVVLPSNNVVLERELQDCLPADVGARFRRIPATGSGPRELRAMAQRSDRAVSELAVEGCDVFAYACLSTSLVEPPGWDAEFADGVRHATGRPAVTTAGAVVAALQFAAAERIVVVTPYPNHVHRLAVAYLESHGFAILHSRTFGVADIDAVGRIAPAEVEELCREAWRTGAEAVAVLATDLNAYAAIGPLEDGLGIPVVTANQALLWASLRALAEREPGRGSGRWRSAVAGSWAAGGDR